MLVGTQVEVLSDKPEGVKGLRGEVLGVDVNGRLQVILPSFDEYLSFAPGQVRRIDDRPKALRDAESRAMAGASFDFTSSTPKRSQPRKVHRLTKRAEELTAEQLCVLLLLLEGGAVLCTVGGRSYVTRRTALGWTVRGLEASDVEHTVAEDLSACSCPDFRFRERKCKHMEAVGHATAVA